MLSPAYDLDRFFEALHDKTWIEILRTTQDEIRSLSCRSGQRKLDPRAAAYLASLKEFEAYLLNPTDPLPTEYKTLVRKMRVTEEQRPREKTDLRYKAKAASAK